MFKKEKKKGDIDRIRTNNEISKKVKLHSFPYCFLLTTERCCQIRVFEESLNAPKYSNALDCIL